MVLISIQHQEKCFEGEVDFLERRGSDPLPQFFHVTETEEKILIKTTHQDWSFEVLPKILDFGGEYDMIMFIFYPFSKGYVSEEVAFSFRIENKRNFFNFLFEMQKVFNHILSRADLQIIRFLFLSLPATFESTPLPCEYDDDIMISVVKVHLPRKIIIGYSQNGSGESIATDVNRRLTWSLEEDTKEILRYSKKGEMDEMLLLSTFLKKEKDYFNFILNNIILRKRINKF